MRYKGYTIPGAALAFIQSKGTVSPDEWEKHISGMGSSASASKLAWEVRKLGHDVKVHKKGRDVTSYEYLPKKGAVMKTAPAPVTTQQAVKAPVAVAPAKAKVLKPSEMKAKMKTAPAPVATSALVMPKDLEKPMVEDTIGSVDADFDNADGDMPAFLRRG